MTQQIDPIQIKGLSSKSVDKLNNLANIQTIGNNLELTEDGTLNAVGGGGGGGGGGDVALYSALGSNTNGALTQKASTDLLVHAKPDGENDLIENNKITTGYLPDSVLGQVLYGGGFVPTTGVATLTANAKERLEVSTPTITLTNDTSSPTGYEANEGIYYIATEAGTFASISFQTGDWLISIGTSWSKVDNTDAVTGVKGANEQNYKLGNVNLSAQNVGAVSSTDAVSTESITPFVTTSMIADGAVKGGNIDFTTLRLSATTLWTGSLYTMNDYIDLPEALVEGDVYIFTVLGNSSTYLMEFPMTCRGTYFQCAYYDGTTVVRWRFIISQNNTRVTLGNLSMNMSSNTALTRIAKVNITARS